jgi:hypothetical protein
VSKEVDKPEGKKAKARMDKRPRRAAGGRVGSDKSRSSVRRLARPEYGSGQAVTEDRCRQCSGQSTHERVEGGH